MIFRDIRTTIYLFIYYRQILDEKIGKYEYDRKTKMGNIFMLSYYSYLPFLYISIFSSKIGPSTYKPVYVNI